MCAQLVLVEPLVIVASSKVNLCQQGIFFVVVVTYSLLVCV